MNHDEWLEPVEVYALGALDGEDLAKCEAHLQAGCELCPRHLNEIRETLTLIPQSLPRLEPPAAVKTRVLQQLPAPLLAAAVLQPRIPWAGWAVGVTAVAALSFILVMSHTTQRSVQQELARRIELTIQLRHELTKLEPLTEFLINPNTRLVELRGLPPSPGASGRLLWNPVTREGVLLTTGLPPIPSDQVYELWALAGAKAIPAGLFSIDAQGRGVLRVPDLPARESYDGFAVTLEPAGGVQQPTGAMHLLGHAYAR
ncbi:MAG: anti-sigma factor [Candidatus Omnitrophica bacterium]|nr:anti-sigma factor [Candidatus Omnitrophota bacterium]